MGIAGFPGAGQRMQSRAGPVFPAAQSRLPLRRKCRCAGHRTVRKARKKSAAASQNPYRVVQAQRIDSADDHASIKPIDIIRRAAAKTLALDEQAVEITVAGPLMPKCDGQNHQPKSIVGLPVTSNLSGKRPVCGSRWR